MSNAAVTKKTQPGESRYPMAPMAAAADPLPMEANRALRPSRSPIAAWPTRPRLKRHDAWTQHAACGSMQGGGGQHDRKDRQQRVSERARGDCGEGQSRDQPLRAGGIDQRAARHLPQQRDQAAGREHEADVNLRPLLRREIDRNEWAEAGLNVGHEENEPVEPAKTVAGGMRGGSFASGGRGTNVERAPDPAARDRLSSRTGLSIDAWRRIAGQTASPALLYQSIGNGCRPPDAPSTTTDCLSLYSGASFSWSRVSSKRNDIALVAIRIEVQCIPVDRDLAAADTEEAAEIDDGRAHTPGAIDNDIDDAPHVFIGAAAHLPAENALHLLRLENSYGGIGRRSRRPDRNRLIGGRRSRPAKREQADRQSSFESCHACHFPMAA